MSVDDAVARALSLARRATNGWACYAKRKIEHDEIASLHRDISSLEKEPSVIELIRRVVTGDGQQLENLAIGDDEWRALARAQEHTDPDQIELTMPVEDWLALVHLARKDGE